MRIKYSSLMPARKGRSTERQFQEHLMARSTIRRSWPGFCKKKENVLASGSHDGGLAVYMPSFWFRVGRFCSCLPATSFLQRRKRADCPGRGRPWRAYAVPGRPPNPRLGWWKGQNDFMGVQNPIRDALNPPMPDGHNAQQLRSMKAR